MNGALAQRDAEVDALRFELQILAALNRGNEMGEPIRTLLARTPLWGFAEMQATAARLEAIAAFLDRAGRSYLFKPFKVQDLIAEVESLASGASRN